MSVITTPAFALWVTWQSSPIYRTGNTARRLWSTKINGSAKSTSHVVYLQKKTVTVMLKKYAGHCTSRTLQSGLCCCHS